MQREWKERGPAVEVVNCFVSDVSSDAKIIGEGACVSKGGSCRNAAYGDITMNMEQDALVVEVKLIPVEEKQGLPEWKAIEAKLESSKLPCVDKQKARFVNGLRQVAEIVLEWQVGFHEILDLARLIIGLASLGLHIKLLLREPRPGGRRIEEELDTEHGDANRLAEELKERARRGDFDDFQKAGGGALFPPIAVLASGARGDRERIVAARRDTFLELLREVQASGRD